MMKRYFLPLIWTALALGSCSKEAPPPETPEPTFGYTLDGQAYSTTAKAVREVMTPQGLTFNSTPLPVTIGGVRYQDRLLVAFTGTGQGPYALRELQLYRTDERGQTQLLEYRTDVTATATSGAKLCSGTFAGKSTNAQGQVVSILSNGVFAYIPAP
ncbi:hypothetical protein [Hymenobacter segetis]|uniref:Lipoprotein n=1 Tax=Hymenobacter segetis TaxID=2025509 RepID=A0ABU9LUY0_9BACT